MFESVIIRSRLIQVSEITEFSNCDQTSVRPLGFEASDPTDKP